MDQLLIFRRRKWSHKSRCVNETDPRSNYAVYTFINSHGGWGNWSMVMIDKIECADGLECRKKERQCIEELNGTLNTYLPIRNTHEYYQDNKAEIWAKAGCKTLCECGSMYSQSNHFRHINTRKHQKYLNSLITE